MIVHDAVKAFVKTLERKSILKPLYKNREMVITFQSEEERIYLQFSEGQCHVLTHMDETPIHTVHFKGNAQTLLDLIQGEEKLPTLKTNHRLSVEGKESHLLALESLFIITNSRDSLLHNHT